MLTENGKKDRKCPIERGNYHRHQKTAGTGCASEQPYKGSRRPQGWNQRKDAAAVLAGRGIFDRLQTGCRRNGGRCNAPASAKSFERGHTAANDRIEQSRGNRKSDYGGTDAAGIQPEILRVQRHSEAFGGTRCTMTDSGRVCWRRCVPRLPGLRLYFRTERALGWRSIRIRLKQPSSGHRNWQHYTFAGTHRSRHRSSLPLYNLYLLLTSVSSSTSVSFDIDRCRTVAGCFGVDALDIPLPGFFHIWHKCRESHAFNG